MDIGRREYREKNDKKNRGSEHTPPDRVEIAYAPAFHVLQRKKTRLPEQVFDGNEKLAVEMGDVGEKMVDQVANRLPRFDILLAANGTKSFRDRGAAIETGFFCSDFTV
jgi:hypothetical protein